MTNRLLAILFCFLVCLKANAQSDKQDIESSIDVLYKAMISQDKSILDKLTTEVLSYGHSTGLVENKSEFEKNIMTGATKFTTIDNTNQSVNITDHIAIVRSITSFKGSNSGGPLDVKIGILMIWQKQGDHWKLLARQGFKLP
jgi:hypothetical protein